MFGVFVGKPKEPTGYRWIEPILDYQPASEYIREELLLKEPYSVTRYDNSIEYYEKSDIVCFLKSKAVGYLGRLYKIPEKWIVEVD